MVSSIFTIAVTGSAGSGKSLVCGRLARFGVPMISCDVLARQVTAPGSTGLFRIQHELGDDVITPDGSLDRGRVRARIAADSGFRKQLEGIVQPLIVQTLFDELNKMDRAGHRVAAAEVPLLFELGLSSRFSLSVLVTAEQEQLIDRVARRDRVTDSQAQALLGLQMAQDRKRALADVVIENHGTVQELEQAVDRFYYQQVHAFA